MDQGKTDSPIQPSEPAVNPGFQGGNFANYQQPSSPSAPSSSGTNVFTPQAAGKKSSLAKNIIVSGILVLLLAGLVLGFDKARSFLSKAEGGCVPENLSETNLTPNSVEIVFQTGKTCQVEVAYGTSSESLLLQVPEASASLNHRVRLSPLLPSTTYYYQVMADGKKVGQVRSFLTKVSQAPTIPPGPTGELVGAVSPTPKISAYTIDDFKSHFGTANTAFDIDKNGIVNTRDWVLYQKSVTK